MIKPDDFLSGSITVARDQHWKFLRSKISPTFTTARLKNVSK